MVMCKLLESYKLLESCSLLVICCFKVLRLGVHVFYARIGKCQIGKWYKSSGFYCLQISGLLWTFTGWNMALRNIQLFLPNLSAQKLPAPIPAMADLAIFTRKLLLSLVLLRANQHEVFSHSWHESDGRKWESVRFWYAFMVFDIVTI